MQIQARDGVPITVHDLGGDGPPLLLAHATGFHGLVWDDFATALARTFRVWSFDVRGHGSSGKAEDMSWRTMGEDVLAVVDALGGDGWLGVGHSLGGALLTIAEATRPGTFRGLYFYEAAVIPPESPRNIAMVQATLRRRPTFGSRKEAFENYAAKPPLNELSAGALWAYVDHGFVDLPDGTVTLACTPADESRTFAGASARDAWESMSLVTCPVTLGRGDAPDAQSPGHTDEQAQLLRAPIEVLPGLGHFGPLAEPERVTTSVLRALGRA